MMIKAGATIFSVKLFEDRKETVVITTEMSSDINGIKNAVESATELQYMTDASELVFKVFGTYKLKTVGTGVDCLKFTFFKSDEAEARIAELERAGAQLEETNANLEAQLTDAQLALAELYELIIGA